MKKLILVVSLVLSSISGLAQTPSPKREFRAAWVASVTNLDFPTATGASVSSLKQQITSLFDQLQGVGMNAVIFQIRPECDALYKSSLEPWSYWISGVQGTGPGDGFDPLAFAVDEAHKRGMELHAWFNPYRAERVAGLYPTASTHVTKRHPEWILKMGTMKMLDPGLPAVRAHIANVIVDVIRRYQVDGIHWDDYFYPYSPNNVTTQDDASFAAYNASGLARADWRRNNVNRLIKMVADSIAAVKPWVKFGISPFGIWKSGVPSGISGTSAYSELYCDAPYWMQQKYLDYLTPQIYWMIGGAQDYSKLMPWWSTQMNGRHLYPGQAAYKMLPSSNWSASELQNQIALNRTMLNPSGSVLFRAKQGVVDNPKGIADSLKNNTYAVRALIPTMPWKDSIPPLPPVNVKAIAWKPGNVLLQWQKPARASDHDTARYFVIYRFPSADSVNLNDARAILSITPNDTTSYRDSTAKDQLAYIYAVTSIDKLHNESAPSFVTVHVTVVAEAAIVPTGEFALRPNYPNPFNPSTRIRFHLSARGYTLVKVYDLLGRNVATLVDKDLDAGTYDVRFSGEKLPSGVYLCRISSGAHAASQRMILQK
ncbi:MAG TPA: family 10 glycosylhydrolase [Bacteroidota bacterium]|nr:family 10 glycosylhydrolase [Bacteroidota bacterium]